MSEATLDKILELKQREGINTTSAIVASAVAFWHRKVYPPSYIERTPNKHASNIDINLAAKRQVELKLAKEKIMRDKKIAPRLRTCQLLQGELINNEQGEPIACSYSTYDKWGTYAQRVPLEMLGADLINNQFNPDRETVLKARPELAEKFNSLNKN